MRKENQYKAAVSLMKKKNLKSIRDTKEKLENLGDYKDSQTKANECSAIIESILKEDSFKAQALLDRKDDYLINMALDSYKQLVSDDEDASRLQMYTERIASINRYFELNNDLKNLNEEHASLRGLFKRNKRLATEAKIEELENEINILRDKLRKHLDLNFTQD